MIQGTIKIEIYCREQTFLTQVMGGFSGDKTF